MFEYENLKEYNIKNSYYKGDNRFIYHFFLFNFLASVPALFFLPKLNFYSRDAIKSDVLDDFPLIAATNAPIFFFVYS